MTIGLPLPQMQQAQASGVQLWQFSALDTWFFREARPFDSIGGAQLASQFPPPARTLAGAVRTAIGEAQNVDWTRFNRGDPAYAELRAQLGDADSYGSFQLRGPYVLEGEERLFPAPLLLLQKDSAIVRLRPGDDVIDCDLGRVRLPKISHPLPGAAPLNGTLLTRTGLERVLAGDVPVVEDDVRPGGSLWSGEERLGIGRDNSRRANVDGLLYQTRHVRPRENITLGVQVAGVEQKFQPANGLIRLGGEGRASGFIVSRDELPRLTSPLLLPPASIRLLLMLLTHADFSGDNGEPDWKPAGFTYDKEEHVWRGEIAGISLTILSAVLGRAVREGGWDLANNRPRPLRSLVPAGSCYFCEVQGDVRQAIETLHHLKIGREIELGRGEIAVGCWDE